MTDERLDRLERMMEQLIKVTASTNATVGELKQRMDTLDQRMDTSEQNVNRLHQRIDILISEVATKNDITRLECMDNGIMDLLESTYREVEKNSGAVDILAGKWVRQESEMQKLRQVK